MNEVAPKLIAATSMTTIRFRFHFSLPFFFGPFRNRIISARSAATTAAPIRISCHVDMYVVTIVAPSSRLLRSFTVNGVILCVNIIPFVTPIASQKMLIIVKTKVRLRKTEAISSVAKIRSAL